MSGADDKRPRSRASQSEASLDPDDDDDDEHTEPRAPLALNPDGVPVYLVNLARWVLWRTEQRLNRKTGKVDPTKPPISWHTGKHCDITDPRSWTSFANVVAAVGKSAAWDGAGFVLGDTDHGEWVIAADIDACLDEDEGIEPWALDLLVILNTYTDKSPGGRGLKPIARVKAADVPEARRLLVLAENEHARTRTFGEKTNGHHAPGAQIFLARKYFTITGRSWHATPEDVALLDLEQIRRLAHWLGPKQPTAAASSGERVSDDDETVPDEATLRDKLGAAFLYNPRLKERWEGGTQGLNDSTRSGRDMSVVAMLVAANFTKGETRAALRLFEHGKLPDETPRYFEQMWSRTIAIPHINPEPTPECEEHRPPFGEDRDPEVEPQDTLPDLFVMKADLPLVSQKLRDRLAGHPSLFERGGPARLTCYPPADSRPAEIHLLGVEGTIHAAHEVCRPYKVDGRGKRNNVTLPDPVAKLYLALNGRWNLRPLHGICGSVLLDNDGGIHAHEGYHAPTGMWCTQAPSLTVPARPAKAEAVDALCRLRAAMRTFTFKGSPLTRIDAIAADVVDIEQNPGLCESAALCGLLTAVCRASLPLAPGVMINAPSVSGSGAGKGLLARMIIAIAFGIIAKAGTAGHDEQELEKRIGASLLRGEPVLLLDNLNNTLLRSAQLESCLTEPLVSVRLFGVLKMQDVRCTAFVAVTGNGLQASGDTARRFVYPTLEPPVDNPEQREYPAGFLDGILARRSELLSDCLTVWRWGRQQSHLQRGLPFGNYERWASWVRDPLLALGCDDPVKGVQDARDRDPHRVNITALFAEWRAWHGSDWVKADDLNFHVRRLIDDKERVPAIRQKLSQLASTRLGGAMLESKVEGNAANRTSLYRVVAAVP